MLRLMKIALWFTLFLLASCSKVDDYWLGKDNTPTPDELAPIKNQVAMKEKWTVPTGSSKNNSGLKLKPVVVGNYIYTADHSGIVQCVDNKKGQVVWSKKINANIISGPTVGQGYIAVGTDSSTLVVLEQNKGEQRWQATVSGDVLSKPAIANNKVIVKTIDGNLYGFELSSGKQLWVSNHGAPGLILKASSSPVIMNNSVALVGYSDGKMDAVDIQTGQTLWQRSIAYARGTSDVERLVDIDADPIVNNNVVLLATYQGYVGALALNSGEFIWRKPASTYSNLVAQGNSLYMVDSDDVVWSYNKQTGQVNWKQASLKARGLTEPVLMENKLVLADKTGMIHVLSTKNGEFLSHKQLDSAVTTALSVVGKNIYVMTNNGKLSRFSVS